MNEGRAICNRVGKEAIENRLTLAANIHINTKG